jgi:hypothetical protein
MWESAGRFNFRVLVDESKAVSGFSGYVRSGVATYNLQPPLRSLQQIFACDDLSAPHQAQLTAPQEGRNGKKIAV